MNRILTAAAALILAPTAVTAVYAQAPVSGASYVRQAGASDQYELQSSRLVLSTTRDREVRRFADRMIADHRKSTADVKAAARQARITVPPPRLDATGTRNVAALRSARGPERDRLYIRQQRMAHEQALALHGGYARRGTITPLRSVAAQVAPVVQGHLTMLRRM